MAAAPFVWREDGRPDWGAMWTTFCDLALHGGPPHRGPDQALRGIDVGSEPTVLAELRRGIFETTGLVVEPGPPGWIAITCESRAMAEWLGAAIALENVEVRVEDDRLLLPSGPRFRLEDEVKSIITVVAKTHHYWATHLGQPLKVAVGGDGKSVLIDALRRRYGRRRAVVASLAQARDMRDHAVDLVLIEVDGAVPGPDAVDATIGVFSAAAAAQAPGGWRLLIIHTAGASRADLARLGPDSAVFVDLTTAEGVDVIVSWLQRELLLDPWRSDRKTRGGSPWPTTC